MHPNRVVEKFGRFMAGQNIKRKFTNEIAALEKQKPVYKPVS